MGPAPDHRRCTALALAALCCLVGSATRVTASDGDWRPLQRHAAGSRAILQDAGSGESFFEFEEQMSGAADLAQPRCSLFPDPGPCRAAIPKWFYSPAALQCQLFAYGGCQGNGNRFDTLEQCTDNCTGTAPAPPVETLPPPVALQGAPPPAPPAGPDCICTLIFAPVCTTTGRDFANQCQAECEGLTVAKNGTCGGTPPPAAGAAATDAPGRKLQAPSSLVAPSPAVPGGGCACIESFAPVCANGTTYENECRARCDDVIEFTQGPCAAAAPAKGRQLLQSSAPPPGGCVCPLVFAPVCAADPATKMNITFENACQADCAQAPVVNNGSCADPPGVLPPTAASCTCTREFRPVCQAATQRQFPNACEARCRGVLDAVEGECGGGGAGLADSAAGPGSPSAGPPPAVTNPPAPLPEAAQQNTLALRLAGCSNDYGVALSVTGAAPAALIAIFKTFNGNAATGLAPAGLNVPGEAVFRSQRCGALPLGLLQNQTFFPRTIRADGTGVAYLSLAPVSSGKTQAACHDTLFVAVDTRNCIATAPVKGR